MRNTFRYNKKTCRYERATINVREVVWYVLGVFTTAAFMLAGMLILHDYLIDSEEEIAFRRANATLERHQIMMAAQLQQVEATLVSLNKKDQELHQKLFQDEEVIVEAVPPPTTSKDELLLADAATFRHVLEKVNHKTARLLEQSSGTNQLFSKKIGIHKDDVDFMASMPTLQPVKSWQLDMLASGFGLKINPFHKGLYDHPGIDISAPRGTEIVASGDGVVSDIKYSALQAGYGNYIEIDHGHGFITRYAHLEDVTVRFNQKIKKGTVIGTVGNSGGSIAPHVHYEILRHHVHVDPAIYMIEGLTSDQHYQLKLRSSRKNQSLD
ncbi:MAG: M23 family metallopeptidase [Bacteroidota bacterium]